MKVLPIIICCLLFYAFLALPIAAVAQSFDVEHQVISFRPDWDKEQLHCRTEISIKLAQNTRKIILDGRLLTIKAIRLADKPLTYQYNDNATQDNLSIDLGKKFRAGEKLTITIGYQTNWSNDTDPANIWGSYGEGVRFHKPSTTEPKRQLQLWTTGTPLGNALWFPGVHSRIDRRTTEIIGEVPRPLSVLSNGSLVSVVEGAVGYRKYHWNEETPHAAHLTSLVVGRYTAVTQEYNGIPIHSYCYPHELDATAATVERLPDMMRYFSEITGVDYPFGSYQQVFVQESGGWMGNMGTSTITENMVDDYVTHKDFRYLWDMVESEALASQWFGVLITPKSWSDTWLSLGFSRHLAGLYNEYKNGRE